MSQKPKKTKSDAPEAVFTVDADSSGVVEMPSITKLLNRKKLSVTKVSTSSEAPSLTPVPTSATIQPAARRKSATTNDALRRWTAESLSKTVDPILSGLRYLSTKASIRAVFFRPIIGSGSGAKVLFHSAAAFAAGESETLWTGLGFEGSVIPDLWNELMQRGWLDPSSTTHAQTQEDLRLFRRFLGLSSDKWVTLIRCGSAETCTGVLAFVSSDPLTDHVRSAFPHLFASGQTNVTPPTAPSIKKKAA